MIRYTKTYLAAALLGGLLSVAQGALAETAQPGNYKIDPGHTNVGFSVNHLGFSNLVGRFNKVSGTIVLDPKGGSSVQVSIDTASVDSNHEKRDVHLRSPDFFNAKQFPEMSFKSTKVEQDAAGVPTKITGELSLHGQKKTVSMDVEAIGAGKDPWGGYRAGYRATTVLKRSDFGMNYMQGGIGDDITVTLDVEAIKQ